MKLTQDIYPVFEANQVLSDLHLNEIFNYLDEQDRLTRANLIGIGIVCGLEISQDIIGTAPAIRLTRGCGVTSEGYLIVEPQDIALVSYRAYTLPSEPDYPPLRDQSSAGEQFDVWELFPAGEPDTTPLSTPANFLSDKAVLLFLELKKEGLRNCSPNNCDDKGSKMTATVRRLLLKVEDLGKVIAAANELEGSLTHADLGGALLARLNLPDVRVPRYDVPNTSPATSRDVLSAFLAVFQTGKLALHTGTALTAAYNAFKPIVQATYPSNPFAAFAATFGFLDHAPKTAAQARFLPYYVDFFDDLLKAYDEFRWKGADLLCACCPPESLFPRHLMLGVLAPGSVANASLYRHTFLASPAVGDCRERTQDVRQLFQRLVEMIARFSNTPTVPEITSRSLTDPQIRITPSKAGDVPLSEQAIPYYYRQDGTPPLYRLWNAEKSRRNRAHHNLSYRSDEYTPVAPAFVAEALRYDLEPYNFLRIEGHLGKEYQSALNTLLTLKERYRLPIDIIALRAGAFDENISVDLSQAECRFQDLETLYDTLREEFLSGLCEGLMYLYAAALDRKVAGLPGGVPKLPLLKKYAPNFRYGESTVGAWYEKYLALLQGRPYIDVDQNKVDQNAVLTVYCVLFAGTTDLPQKNYAHVVSIYYLTKLAEVLPATLNALGFDDFQNKCQDLMGLIRFFRSEAVSNISSEFKNFIPQEDLIDHFDQVLFSSKLEPIRAVHEEYVRRVREVKQKHSLSIFLRDHPGIQHKAGVPLGGTFILVYHDEPSGLRTNLDLKAIEAATSPITRVGRKVTVSEKAISEALTRIGAKKEYAEDPDVRVLFGALTGRVPDFRKPSGSIPDADKIIDATVRELAGGTVIADFFLPYLYCSGCASVQFVLPKTPPTFTVELGCTAPGTGTAEATVTAKGGEAPYTYRLDNADISLPLTGNLVLSPGAHTLVIQDSAGTESAPRSVTVPAPLAIEKEQYVDDATAKTYQVIVPVSGGTAPYKAEGGTVAGSTVTSAAVASGEAVTVSITDHVGCKISKEFRHAVCDLPCSGVSRRCAYRLWLQPPVGEARYETYRQEGEAIKFRFNGTDIALPGSNAILQAGTAELNESFQNTMAGIIKKLNAVINQELVTALGPEGKNRLVVTYKPASTDPFGVLWIEHFVCETFSLEFNVAISKPSPAFSLVWRYTNEPDAAGAPFNGAIMVNRRLKKETRIPAFNCSERNQCTGSDYTKLCQGPDPKLQFEMTPRRTNTMALQADVSNVPAADIVAWLWDLSAPSSEPLYEGQQVVVALERPQGVIRLTAITNNGCFGVVQRNIAQ